MVKYVGKPEDRLIEECAEVIQAITKIKRFGINGHHPDRPGTTNKYDVIREIKDLKRAIDDYEKEI